MIIFNQPKSEDIHLAAWKDAQSKEVKIIGEMEFKEMIQTDHDNT